MRAEGKLSEVSGHKLVAIDNVYLSSDSSSVTSFDLTPGYKLSPGTCTKPHQLLLQHGQASLEC